MHVGLVTYNIAKDWELDTLLDNCRDLGIEGVELRTSHAHGVEPELGKNERAAVRAKFDAAGVRLWGLGSTCEYHSPDPKVLRENIESTKRFVDLAADCGAKGVKVRPNGLPEEVPVDTTLAQIGEALGEVGRYADTKGVEIWLEVHGHGTNHVPYVEKIMDTADHPAVGVCWNCNPADIVDGSIRENFARLKERIRSVHTRDLCLPDYPWQQLFELLHDAGYDRYTLAEIPDNADPARILGYYKALWEAYVEAARIRAAAG